MKKAIQTVGLFGKYRDRSVGGLIQELATFLKRRGLSVLLEETTASLLERPPAEGRPLETIGQEIDLAIVVGGDGTMLHVARALAAQRVPIIGVNQGRLGFLTDLQAQNMIAELDKILAGHFKTEQRLLLQAEIVRGGHVVHAANAFNDVIVNKGELARLIEFETYLDGEFVNGTRGDGIIVASPTGSTAYALSAGGPILHPNLAAMVLVPICPHTLSHRPIVVSSEATVEVVLTGLTENHAHVTFDGQSTYSLRDADRVRVRRAPEPAELIHPVARSHFEVLRIKLRWGEKF